MVPRWHRARAGAQLPGKCCQELTKDRRDGTVASASSLVAGVESQQ